MSRMVEIGARKLPTMLGAGILAISIVGLAAAALGITFTLVGELVSASVGMAVASRFA